MGSSVSVDKERIARIPQIIYLLLAFERASPERLRRISAPYVNIMFLSTLFRVIFDLCCEKEDFNKEIYSDASFYICVG
jgi:hypothetical protein